MRAAVSRMPHDERSSRMRRIAELLLANRFGREDWGEISHLDGRPTHKERS